MNGFNGEGGIMLEKRSGRLCPRILTLSIKLQENPGATVIGSMIRMRSGVLLKKGFQSKPSAPPRAFSHLQNHLKGGRIMYEHIGQFFKMLVAGTGAVTGYVWGGWSLPLHLLLWFVVIDWLTGWGAAWMNGELRSRIGYTGIARKMTIFLIIALMHLVDRVLGEMNYFQNTVIFFYLANELLSIIENVGRMGVPIPQSLRNVVQVFQIKSEEGEKTTAQKEEKKDEAL
jgi:toxin secretion/phage lysis holin